MTWFTIFFFLLGFVLFTTHLIAVRNWTFKNWLMFCIQQIDLCCIITTLSMFLYIESEFHIIRLSLRLFFEDFSMLKQQRIKWKKKRPFVAFSTIHICQFKHIINRELQFSPPRSNQSRYLFLFSGKVNCYFSFCKGSRTKENCAHEMGSLCVTQEQKW